MNSAIIVPSVQKALVAIALILLLPGRNAMAQTAPAAGTPSVTSSPDGDGYDGWYRIGDVISVNVPFDAPVTVNTENGSPTIEVSVNGKRDFVYDSASSTTRELVFQYTVREGDEDRNGIQIGSSTRSGVELNGATITSSDGMEAHLKYGFVGNPQHKVDGVKPGIRVWNTRTAAPADTVYRGDYRVGITQLMNSEPLTILDSAKITVTNGSLDITTPEDSSAAAHGFYGTVTPVRNFAGKVIVKVAAGAFVDRAGNVNANSDSDTTLVDTRFPPGPTSGVTAKGDGQTAIVVNWTAPAKTGSSAITGYKIESSNRVAGDGVNLVWEVVTENTMSTETTYRHTGLTPFTWFWYRVSAINDAGAGPGSTGAQWGITAPPNLAAGASPVAEGTPATFTLMREGSTAAGLRVRMVVTETGSMIKEEELATRLDSVLVNFDVDSPKATLTVPTEDDSTDEPNSEISVRYNFVAPGTDTVWVKVTVNDNDYAVDPCAAVSSTDVLWSSCLTVGGTGTGPFGWDSGGMSVTGGALSVRDFMYHKKPYEVSSIFFTPEESELRLVFETNVGDIANADTRAELDFHVDDQVFNLGAAAYAEEMGAHTLTLSVDSFTWTAGNRIALRITAVDPPAAAPQEPRGVYTELGSVDTELVLHWYPIHDGGSPVDSIQYTRDGPGSEHDIENWKTIPDSGKPDPDTPGSGANYRSYTDTALTTGSQYTYRLRAVNEVGEGPPSRAFTGEPRGVPGNNSVTTTMVLGHRHASAVRQGKTPEVGRPFFVTFTFSEDVRGFTPSDVHVTNANVVRVDPDRLYTVYDHNLHWDRKFRALIHPTGSEEVTVSLPGGRVFNPAGNGNLASRMQTFKYAPSATRSMVYIMKPSESTVCETTGNGFCVSIAFLEWGIVGVPVKGFTPSDLTLTNGKVTKLVSREIWGYSIMEGSEEAHYYPKWLAVIQPDDDYAGAFTVCMDENLAEDIAGNGNLASNTYTRTVTAVSEQEEPDDLEAPAVTLTSDAEGPISEEFTVTVVFSEPVSGFTMSELEVTNGQAMQMLGLPGGKEYVVTIVPDEGAEGEVTVTVPASVAMDEADNPNTASSTFRIALAWDPIAGFTLFDNGNGGQEVQTLTGGTVLIGLSSDRLNVRAEVRSGTTIGSVRMELTGAAVSARTEGYVPYALFGDRGGQSFPPGEYMVSATPYPERHLGGEPGRKRSVSFRVVLPRMSIADARAQEGVDETIEFVVSLDAASGRQVTVDYATLEGTAHAGVDYTENIGTLTFTPGVTRRTIAVEVLVDAHDEGEETFILRLTNAAHATLADDEATGTITNNGEMPKAWLARFGRAVANQVTDAVSARLTGLRSSHVTVGGMRMQAHKDAARRGHETVDTRWPAATAGEWDPLPDDVRNPRRRNMTGRELMLGSSFHLSTDASAKRGPVLAVWGHAGTGGFKAEQDALNLSGDVTTGLVALDTEWNRWVVGTAFSHAMGKGSYMPGGGTAANYGKNEVESTLTGVYPYARVLLRKRISLWGLAGYGRGDIKLTEPVGTPIETGIDMKMGALGVRGTLLSPAQGMDFEVAVKSDAFWMRMGSEAVNSVKTGNLNASLANVSRLRLVLEGSRVFALGEGTTLTPSAEVGARQDAGDAETGSGLEVGVRLRYANTGLGLTIEGAVRSLVLHEKSGYEEWGASGSIRLNPGASGRGFSLALVPRVGATSSGVERLWSHRNGRGRKIRTHHDFEPGRRLDADIAYGFGRAVHTPYAGLSLRGHDGRDYRLGGRIKLAGRVGVNIEVVREARVQGPAVNGLRLRCSLHW